MVFLFYILYTLFWDEDRIRNYDFFDRESEKKIIPEKYFLSKNNILTCFCIFVFIVFIFRFFLSNKFIIVIQ